MLEAQHPVRVEEYGLIADSGGAGKWRGGLGVRRSYRLLADEAFLQLRADRVKFQPYGLEGGAPGAPSRNFLVRAGANRPEPLPGKTSLTLRQGDLVIHEQAGGGGFGDPGLRSPDDIARDILQEKITPAFSAAHYGAVEAPAGE